jgi:hypothetical protein
MWLEMAWGSETEQKNSLATLVVGWRPSVTPWFSLAALQTVSISWKALGYCPETYGNDQCY